MIFNILITISSALFFVAMAVATVPLSGVEFYVAVSVDAMMGGLMGVLLYIAWKQAPFGKKP
jgi:hypothetical protein